MNVGGWNSTGIFTRENMFCTCISGWVVGRFHRSFRNDPESLQSLLMETQLYAGPPVNGTVIHSSRYSTCFLDGSHHSLSRVSPLLSKLDGNGRGEDSKLFHYCAPATSVFPLVPCREGSPSL